MGDSWRKTLLHPYYALHAAAVGSYLILHHIALCSEGSPSRLQKWEIQAALSLGFLLLIKYVRRISREALLADVLLYSKVMVSLLAFLLDWRLLAWYLVLFAIMFLLCVQPSPENQGNVLVLSPLQLENLLTEGSQTVNWMVEFGAVWSPRCIHLKQLFTDLSVKYSRSGVQFARIDLGRFPSAAAKYGIEMGVALRQIPTLIMFEGGLEVSRLPEPNGDGTFAAQSMSEAYIVQKFGLDARLLQSMSRKVRVSYNYQNIKQQD